MKRATPRRVHPCRDGTAQAIALGSGTPRPDAAVRLSNGYRMQQLFAVIRSRGATWRNDRAMEEQTDWDAHATFMEGLAAEGFVVLVGPLEGTPDVLLVARAASADAVARRLAADPWSTQDLLRVTRIDPWTLRLGTL